jgi:hypothetical protein
MDKSVMTIARYALAVVCAAAIACSRPPRLAAHLVIADLVILTDTFTIPAATIEHVRVLTTIVGGTVVYQRNP